MTESVFAISKRELEKTHDRARMKRHTLLGNLAMN